MEFDNSIRSGLDCTETQSSVFSGVICLVVVPDDSHLGSLF